MSDSTDREPKLSEGEFMRLFVKHEPALRAFARSILPDWNAVDDALQEASVTMWAKLSQLRDQEGFLPWAKVILRFKCLSMISAMRRDRRVLSNDMLNLIADEAEAADATHVVDVRHALSVCMKQFSTSHQQLLLAPYDGDGAVKQLAENAGKSANAFYKLLGRLREKITQCVHRKLSVEVAR